MDIKSAWLSKINWTQAIGFLAMIGTVLGFDLDAETQKNLLALIVAGQAVLTWVLRTWFTKTVTPSVAAKN